MGEFRIAFVGDSITAGNFGTTIEEMDALPQEPRLVDNKVGWVGGQYNTYPALLRNLLA